MTTRDAPSICFSHIKESAGELQKQRNSQERDLRQVKHFFFKSFVFENPMKMNVKLCCCYKWQCELS